MTDEQFYDEAYSILVDLGGASERMREFFLSSFTEEGSFFRGAEEWRFQGKLGFGGKFWRVDHPIRHYVSCYSEDENPKTRSLVTEINKRLTELDLRRTTT